MASRKLAGPSVLRLSCLLALAAACLAEAAAPGSVQVSRSAVRVAPAETDQVSVAWSPTGDRVAYLQRKAAGSGVFNLFVKEVRSRKEPVVVTKDADQASAFSLPIWSPDGNALGFLSVDGYYKTASATGSGVTTTSRLGLTCFGGNAGSVAVDGRHYIAARIAGQISLLGIRPNGSLLSLDPMANGTPVTAFGPGIRVLERRMAPDHSKLAFAVASDSGTTTIYVLERVPDLLSGRATRPTSLGDPLIRRVTEGGVYDAVPTFGGDGSLLILASSPSFFPPQDCVPNSETSESLFGSGRFDLTAVAASGARARAPVSALNTVRSEVFPSLSPDGMQIAFVRDDSGLFQIYTSELAYQADIAASGGNRVVRDATGTSVSVPDGALTQLAQLIVSVPAGIPDEAGRTLPRGVMPVRAVRLIEKTQFEALKSKVFISLAYTPAEVAGLDESTLGAFRYDTSAGEWELMGGTVDRAARTVTFQTDTLGIFGVAGSPASAATAATAASAIAAAPGASAGGCAFAAPGKGDRGELAAMMAMILLFLTTFRAGGSTTPRKR